MRILIVEDEPGIASFLQQGLEEEAYIVNAAADGLEGLRMAVGYDYDFLLLDWMLPSMGVIKIYIVKQTAIQTTEKQNNTIQTDDILDGIRLEYQKEDKVFNSL